MDLNKKLTKPNPICTEKSPSRVTSVLSGNPNSWFAGEDLLLYFFLFRDGLQIWYFFAMQNNVCSTCGKSKAALNCGICESTICKYCTQFMDEGTFSFLSVTPVEFTHQSYCFYCYDSQVAPALAEYQQDIINAKNILVFTKDQKKETRLIKRLEDPVEVTNCPDHKETLLRLAFFAMKKGYNAIIDVDIKSEKIRSGSYQTTNWSGWGVPATVIESKLLRDKSFSQDPN